MASKSVTANKHPELIFYGQHSGVVGLRKSELFDAVYSTEISHRGYDKVKMRFSLFARTNVFSLGFL